MCNMKKFLNWILAAILICGAMTFTACSSGDDDNQQPVVQPEQPDDDGTNTGDDNGNDNNLNDVKGNVDVNNGGGGVNEVR